MTKLRLYNGHYKEMKDKVAKMTPDQFKEFADHIWVRSYPMSERVIKADNSPSVRYILDHPSGCPEEDLANAIVAMAADDYRLALRDQNEALCKELEAFFFSGFYKTLTKLDPHYLVDRLKDEYAAEFGLQ